MKIKLAKTASHAYLFADGHAVVIHKEDHAKAGEVEWAEIFEKLDIHCAFSGRIVFHHLKYDGRFALVCNAYCVRCSEPSVEHGSENTKRHNIRCHHFEIEYKDGRQNLSWTLMPDLISDGLTYQPNENEVFADIADKYHWCNARISQVHRIPKAEPVAEPVAA